ncbi:MAG: hypothetical protein Q8J63_01020 [Candidatus Aquicultor sp.]|nr:hypothetical protein [Candidatus Aquicultor sp.]
MPSKRVYREMNSEVASLWFVPANDGTEVAVLLKAPTSSIKALIAGCSLRFTFGINDSYLCTGARVFDMPDAPVSISGVQRELEEHDALQRVLQERRFPIFLFNEMDVCLAWTNADLSVEDASRVFSLIDPISELYNGVFTGDASHALDCFCFSIDNTDMYDSAYQIATVETPVTVEDWRIINAVFIGHQDHHMITIDDEDEGEMFERAIWSSLESVFPLTLYKSPQAQTGEKVREFTDVLTFYDYGSFLIEAKDLSILKAGYGRSQERRTNSVQKQTKKAIRQLIGASRALKRGDAIFDAKGNELIPNRDQPPHCIILITELMHWGDWSEIEALLMDAIKTTGAFFHLIDLREFITLLKGSSGDAKLLDYNLMGRFKHFVETGSIHIRSQIAPSQEGQHEKY